MTEQPENIFVAKAELEGRGAAVRAAMRERGVAVSIFTTPENIHYVGGYHTRAITASQALIVSEDTDIVLVTRQMDAGNYLRIRDRSPITRHLTFTDDQMQDSMQIIAATARDLMKRQDGVGTEPDGSFMSPRQYDLLRASLGDTEIVNIGAVVDTLRHVKSPFEVECHRRAGRMTVTAMNHAVAEVKAGVTDSAIAAEVASSLIRAGSEWVATWPIIFTGHETGRAHSSWQNEAIRPGMPTALEFSAARQRYHSPLFRTVIIAPTQEQIHLSEAVAKAHEAGLRTMRAGVTAEDVYLAEREVVASYGAVELMSGRVGYAVGISFAPNWVQRNGIDLMKGNRTVLQPGMVFHVATMLMRANEFGIAHSATVVVTEDGNEVLTEDGVTGPILR